MLEIKEFRVRSLDLDYLDLYWEIDNTSEDPYSYTFTVERSESPLGPWDQVSPEFSDKYSFRDITVNLLNRFRFYYYRIKIKRKSDNNIIYSELAQNTNKPDLVAQEVRRLENLVFQEYIGRAVWLFPRRTFGQRCPNCWEDVTGQRVISGCVTCFDTGWARGFLDPIKCWIQFDPTVKHIENSQLIETQQQNASARLGHFPIVKPKDIIVESDNVRWRVERASDTQRLRAVLHQELVLHQIPRGDIEYKLPINIDSLGELEASAGRNFTNPHNLSAHTDAELWDATRAFYGYRG
jgi:hypothetical protein